MIKTNNKLNIAKKIHAVWNVNSKFINDIISNEMSRNENEEYIKKNKIIKLPIFGFEFLIPQLPGVKNTVVKLSFNNRDRGVVDNYIFLHSFDLDLPKAVIVITELPEHLRNKEYAFKAVKSLQKHLSLGNKIHFSNTTNNSLELIVKDRKSSTLFPTAKYCISSEKNEPNTLGISHFSFVNNYLVEISLILEAPKNTEDSNFVEYAKIIINDFEKNIKFTH